MKCFNIIFVITIAILIDEGRCGVIRSVYGEISNRTKAVKDDVYSWWSYGVDTVMGSVDDIPVQDLRKTMTENAESVVDKTKIEVEKESGIISGIYNKVKGGFTYGYMKVHNVVLGQDSDPNKGIIRTFYERAMNRLSKIRDYIFGGTLGISEKEAQEKENEREKVLKVLFGNNTNLFNSENEKQALDSLRNKLTQETDKTLYLLDSERDVIKKAYEYVKNNSDELKTGTNNLGNNIKNTAQESADTTQDFIKNASNKVSEDAQKVYEYVHDKSGELKTGANNLANNIVNKAQENVDSTQEFIKNASNKVSEDTQKVYEYIHSKSDELKTGTNNLGKNIKNKAQESMDTTQEFIKNASNKMSEDAQNFGENMKKSADDMIYKLQSE